MKEEDFNFFYAKPCKYNIPSEELLLPLELSVVETAESGNGNSKGVRLGDIITSEAFRQSRSPLTIAVGKNEKGDPVVNNLKTMAHLMIFGNEKSEKENFLLAVLTGLMYKASPEELRFLLIDPKGDAFNKMSDLPHLLFNTILRNGKDVYEALIRISNELNERYKAFLHLKVRNVASYNSSEKVLNKQMPRMPYIIVAVNEVDLLTTDQYSSMTVQLLVGFAQRARAAGVHLIINASDKINVYTDDLLLNIPSRIAFGVSDAQVSRKIINAEGAEKLLRNGEMYFYPSDFIDPARIRSVYIDEKESNRIFEYIKAHNVSEYY